ncbi:MAG: Imm32 family immunity protein [Aeoliella sp.]
MKSKNITVEFDINDDGCPIVASPARAFASAAFAPAGADRPRDQITIDANRDGLLTLARWMIALADEDSYADHQHFDNDVDFGSSNRTPTAS